jgi:hypothetical protein
MASRRTVIWLDPRGKAGLFDAQGDLAAPIRALLDGGASVTGVDLLDQGEFLADGKPLARQRWLENEEGFAGWTYCYNLPLFARRVHAILAIVEVARSQQNQSVALVGFGPAAAWAAAAVVQANGSIARAALDTQGFRFSNIGDVYDAHFLPGAVKYGDLPGLLALAAPTPIWLAGEGETPPSGVDAAYQASKKPNHLVLAQPTQQVAAEAVQWLLSQSD